MVSSVDDSRKRKRITTCLECHRRKQKCNRAKPCNICVARNVPERCTYGDTTATAKQTFRDHDAVSKRQRRDDDEFQDDNDAPTRSSTLSDQLGYSSTHGGNALMTLAKSLREPNDQHLRLHGPHISAFPISRKDRYCFLALQLPSKVTIEELVGHYYQEANWYSCILEPAYFNKLMTAWFDASDSIFNKSSLMAISRNVQFCPALMFQVLASAVLLVQPGTPLAKALDLTGPESLEPLAQKYSRIGMELMALLGRHEPAIPSIEHDLARAGYLKNCSRGREAWQILATAIRQAQDLGLHLEPADTQAANQNGEESVGRLWHDEYRRRLWSSLFNWDAHMSSMLGRPRAINLHDCTVKPPLDCSIPDDPATTKKIPSHPAEHEAPSNYSPHVFSNAISRLMHSMLSSDISKQHGQDYRMVKDLDAQASMLLDALPAPLHPTNPDTSWDSRFPTLTRQREQVLTMGHAFIMSLHRPHAATRKESREAGTRAAVELLKSQERLFDLIPSIYHRSFAFTLSCHTINPAIFLAATMLDNPEHGPVYADEINGALAQAIRRLDLLKQHSPMADSGVNVLRHCCEQIEEKYGPATGIPDIKTSTHHQLPTPDSHRYSGDLDNGSDCKAEAAFDKSLPSNANLDWDNGFAIGAYDPASFEVLDGFNDFNDFDESYWKDYVAQTTHLPFGPAASGNGWDYGLN